jgi:hypothetical protein
MTRAAVSLVLAVAALLGRAGADRDRVLRGAIFGGIDLNLSVGGMNAAADSCILSSDLGQRGNALPPDGLGDFLLALRARGFTDAQLDRISKQNPARLLDLK